MFESNQPLSGTKVMSTHTHNFNHIIHLMSFLSYFCYINHLWDMLIILFSIAAIVNN